MARFYHAHRIDLQKCDGQMKCMRSCPTQAIRVKNGKAAFSEDLCVDCGTCLSACQSGAMVPITDPLEDFSKFKYKVVVPAAVLYSQFDSSVHPYIIHKALKKLGFDEVVDLNFSTAVLGNVLMKYLSTYKGPLPLISSHCPALIRLIQVKYPELIKHIIPLDVPRELTAREIRKTLPKKLGLKPEEIGITYIASCPAKIVSIKQPAEKTKSWFDGVLSIKDVFSLLYPHVLTIKENFDESEVPDDFSFSISWARLGGIINAVKMENWIAVSGLDHVMKVLDDIENSRLRNIEFVEAMTCMLGCIGGPYNVENAYIARANIIKQSIKHETSIEVDEDEISRNYDKGYYFFENAILPRPTKYFDTDLVTSIKRIKERDRVYQKLPKIDCGCCGAPTCLAFAEDFVRGETELSDCVILAQKLSNS
ncbi:hypothetical protein B6I21_00675 [candidate division KSB1 bacterium 4572_119]|nr:MAG: hypothetical protein B6I21_00675 [candidate division KSB1 bacterium 4572_119]